MFIPTLDRVFLHSLVLACSDSALRSYVLGIAVVHTRLRSAVIAELFVCAQGSQNTSWDRGGSCPFLSAKIMFEVGARGCSYPSPSSSNRGVVSVRSAFADNVTT